MKFLEKTYACAITGHRPTRFKFKYNEGYSLCKKIKKAMLKTFCHLHDEEGIFRFYVGGALGVDMWAAEQLLYLKEQPGYQDIELIVALPFEGHDSKWDAMSKQRLQIIIHNATKCIVIVHNIWKPSGCRITQWGQLGEILGGVRFPWAGSLPVTDDFPICAGCQGQMAHNKKTNRILYFAGNGAGLMACPVFRLT